MGWVQGWGRPAVLYTRNRETLQVGMEGGRGRWQLWVLGKSAMFLTVGWGWLGVRTWEESPLQTLLFF